MQAKTAEYANMEQQTEGEDSFQETEIGLIPMDWEVSTLGDLFDLQQGKAMSPKSRLGISPRPFLRTANVLWGRVDLSTLDYMDFTDEEITKLCLRPYDLLVCEGGEIGRTAMWRGEVEVCGYQNHIHRLRKLSQDIEPEFYMYWMQAAFLDFGLYTGEAIRTTIPNLSGGRLKSFVVPKPPVPEQQRIAKVLGTIQRTIEQQDKIIEATKTLKNSLMQKLFSEGLYEEEQKETEIGKIPESWDISNLDDRCLDIVDCLHSLKPKEQKLGKICLQVYNIGSSGKLDLTSIYRISESDFKLWTSRIKPQKGDIIISKTGRVGAIAQILDDNEYCIGRNLVLIRPDNKKIESFYLRYYMLSRLFRSEVKRLTHLGTILRSLHVAKIPRLKVVIPSREEQKQIASVFEILYKKIEMEQRKKVAFQELFKTMLHRLMTGEIRFKEIEV